ncbi:MAG: hypothetical protein ACHP6I_03515 [Rickettsiales bacterium]
MFNRVKTIMEQYGQFDSALANQFKSLYQVSALDIVLKNGQPATDALKFVGKTANSNMFNEFNALKLGFPVSAALKIDTKDKLNEARNLVAKVGIEQTLKMFGVSSSNDKAGFTNPYQIEALNILGKNNLSDAEKFTDSVKIAALKFLGNDHVADALKFSTDFQEKALEKMGLNFINIALQVTEDKFLGRCNAMFNKINPNMKEALGMVKDLSVFEKAKGEMYDLFSKASKIQTTFQLEVLNTMPDSLNISKKLDYAAKIVDTFQVDCVKEVHNHGDDISILQECLDVHTHDGLVNFMTNHGFTNHDFS